MNDAFYIAATGMQAQQVSLDTIANNLTNMSTIGYKRSQVNFSDLVAGAPPVADAGGAATGAVPIPAALRIGAGVGIAAIAKQFDAGDIKQTGAPLDVAIQGDGFLEVTLPDGTRAYTRGGSLKVALDGQLVTPSGLPLAPGIAITSGAQNLTITPDGRVQYTVPGRSATVEAGQLTLVRFADPSRLAVQGDNLYRATDASGEPITGKAGEDGMGTLAQGMLESSNVKMIDELVGMMVAQRAYEASVKVVQAADEMASLANGLRR